MREDEPVTFTAGNPFVTEVTAGKLTRIANQSAEMARRLNRWGSLDDPSALPEHWVGKIVASGPDGDADLAPASRQYWVEKQSPKTSLAYGAELTVEKDPATFEVGRTSTVVKATHVTKAATGTTFVAGRISAGTPVHVFSEVFDVAPKPQTFYYFFLEPAGTFRVKVESTSGSRGGPTTAASWVYTVKDRATNEVIGTGKSPLVRVWPWAADAATYGLADYETDGTLTLVEVFEPQTRGAC